MKGDYQERGYTNAERKRRAVSNKRSIDQLAGKLALLAMWEKQPGAAAFAYAQELRHKCTKLRAQLRVKNILPEELDDPLLQ
jgi:hypothetical protein